MDIATLISNIHADGSLDSVINNKLAQFGLGPRTYLGATLLPEQDVLENAYTEENVRYRTIIANDGSRYSPVQRKRGELVGSFEVRLGNSDIGRELSGREYEVLLQLIGRKAPMEAVPAIINWTDVVLTRALQELCEKQRWEAIVSGSVVRTGHNNYTETVTYANPAGHRAAAAGTWSNNSYDPYADITTMVNLLRSKGYTVNRIITKQAVVSILSLNTLMRQRVGITTLSPGVLAGVNPGFLDLNAINQVLTRDNLPPIETYDLQYRTQSGTSAFIPGNVMVFACTTGRDQSIDLGDSTKLVTDTLGYLAVGTPVGQAAPSRVVKLFPKEDKPPRIDGQAWQTTLPVITEPEALAVITGIS